MLESVLPSAMRLILRSGVWSIGEGLPISYPHIIIFLINFGYLVFQQGSASSVWYVMEKAVQVSEFSCLKHGSDTCHLPISSITISYTVILLSCPWFRDSGPDCPQLYSYSKIFMIPPVLKAFNVAQTTQAWSGISSPICRNYWAHTMWILLHSRLTWFQN